MRGRRLRSAALALVVSLGLAVGSALPFFIANDSASAAPVLAASIYPELGAVATPGEPFTLTLTVTNTGTEVAPGIRAELRSSSQPFRAVREAAEWMHGADVRRNPALLASIDVGDIPAGESRTVTSTVTFAEGDLGDGWGVVGLQADLMGGESVVSARTAIVWANGSMPARAGFVPIVPLVAPANPDAFLDATTLEKLTASGQILQRQLDAAQVASLVAIDPRIIASILRLKDKAPEVARSWLTQVQAMATPTFALQYGDADPALAGQVGFSQLLPVTFDGVAALENAPTDVLWSPTLTNVVWAEPRTLTNSSLTAILNTAGLGASKPASMSAKLLIAGSQISGATENARVSIQSKASDMPDVLVEAVVLNDDFTSALRAAENAQSDTAWTQSVIEAGAYLAVIASNGGGELAGGFSRALEPARASLRTSETIAYLRGLPWSSQQAFNALLNQSGPSTRLMETPESSDRLDGGLRVFSSYGQLQNFSSASSQPGLVTGFAGRSHSPLLSVAWNAQGSDWASALAGLSSTTRSYIDEVHFGLTSNINMVGGQASIPITIINGHSFDVTASVHAVPSNPRLTVGADQLITIPADSQGTVKIPVSARVGNGDVNLTLTMASPSGEPIGEPVVVSVRVRADWEGFGLVIMGLLFIALVITGVIRTIRRRKPGVDAT
jgi:hypothetical protein